jgi:hypothetical protein
MNFCVGYTFGADSVFADSTCLQQTIWNACRFVCLCLLFHSSLVTWVAEYKLLLARFISDEVDHFRTLYVLLVTCFYVCSWFVGA